VLIGVQTTRSKIAVEIANRKIVSISAQTKGLHYFDIFRALLEQCRHGLLADLSVTYYLTLTYIVSLYDAIHSSIFIFNTILNTVLRYHKPSKSCSSILRHYLRRS